MGIRCSCGIMTNPVATGLFPYFFLQDNSVRNGTITFTINACADRLEQSTLTATFVDQSGELPNRSFTFTSTNVTSVNCMDPEGGLCTIVIEGTGLVTGETTPRTFNFAFRDPSVFGFTITGFGTNIAPQVVQPTPIYFC